MRRAVLFLILSFAVYAAGQSRGTASGGMSGAASAGTVSGATAPHVSPGMNGQPATGPAAEAPTTNLGPSTTQPLGVGQVTNGSVGTSSFGANGGFITNGGYGSGGYVPMLQTPEATLPSGITHIPNNPAGISNNPSALEYANTPSNHEGVFNTGAATFGMSPGVPPDKSLGEIAREVRAQHGVEHASRVYTNADIARLNQSNGQVALGSNLGPQSNAQATPNQIPSSPTIPAVNANPAQPGQNRNLPGHEAQPPQPQR